MTRRDLIHTAVLGGAGLVSSHPAMAVPFSLPALPYAFDALEPHIDAKTMEIQDERHHQAYLDNLNKTIGGDPKLSALTVEELLIHLDTLPESIRAAVRNNGGGHANHSLFWQNLAKPTGQAPKGSLAAAIDETFGSRSAFENKLKTTAAGVFGSGWVWLSLDRSNQLVLESYPNQDSPLLRGQRPLLGIDVWEHAYYLKYQHRRPEYLAAILNVINWGSVSARFEKLTK